MANIVDGNVGIDFYSLYAAGVAVYVGSTVLIVGISSHREKMGRGHSITLCPLLCVLWFFIMVSGRQWCFTLNNYDVHDCAEIDAWQRVTYVVYGREVGESGTSHLQGYVVFENARSFNAVRQRLRGRGHWELTRGTPEQAAAYCKKDGDFVERGQLPQGQGHRSDLRNLEQWVVDFIQANRRAPTDREWARFQFSAFVRYPRIVEAARRRAESEAPVVLRQGEPRTWQGDLAQELLQDADDRSIIFYVDEEGNTGKTWFQQWFYSEHSEIVQLLGVGRRDDMAYMIDETKSVFFVNVPRGGMEYLQYSILEQLKDKMVVSPKYHSCVKMWTKAPHVIVFCNEAPDYAKLSHDRIVIRNISLN